MFSSMIAAFLTVLLVLHAAAASATESGEARAHRLRTRPTPKELQAAASPSFFDTTTPSSFKIGIQLSNVNLAGFGPAELKCIEHQAQEAFNIVDISLRSAGTTMSLEQPGAMGTLDMELDVSAVPTSSTTERRLSTDDEQMVCAHVRERCSPEAFGAVEDCSVSFKAASTSED